MLYQFDYYLLIYKFFEQKLVDLCNGAIGDVKRPYLRVSETVTDWMTCVLLVKTKMLMYFA